MSRFIIGQEGMRPRRTTAEILYAKTRDKSAWPSRNPSQKENSARFVFRRVVLRQHSTCGRPIPRPGAARRPSYMPWTRERGNWQDSFAFRPDGRPLGECRRNGLRPRQSALSRALYSLISVEGEITVPTRTAIWEHDVIADPRPTERGPNHLRCFLI